MKKDERIARHLTNSSISRCYELSIANTSVEHGFLILNGCDDGIQIAGVVCSDDVLCDYATVHNMRHFYLSLQASQRRLSLLTQPGRKTLAQELLNKVTHTEILPALPPHFG